MEMWLENLKNDLFSEMFAHYVAISPPTNATSHILALFFRKILSFSIIFYCFFTKHLKIANFVKLLSISRCPKIVQF